MRGPRTEDSAQVRSPRLLAPSLVRHLIMQIRVSRRTYFDVVYNRLSGRLAPMDLTIVLDLPVPVLMDRIRKRARSYETNMPVAYIERLTAFYRDHKDALGPCVCYLDLTGRETREEVARISRGKRSRSDAAMKNQYVGDICDFAKYGLLRWLSSAGPSRLRVGVIWYLTENAPTGDGRGSRRSR